MLILQRRGRVTAAELAAQLEVCERTVLRDIEELSGAGVPVYATRGPGGGFQRLGGYTPELAGPEHWQPQARRHGRPRRAHVQVTPDGQRLAVVLGRLQPLRIRRTPPPAENGWLDASFRLDTIEGAVTEILSLGPSIRVLQPRELRDQVADRVHPTAQLYPGHRAVCTE